MCWKINFLWIHWYFAAIFISLAELNLYFYLFDQVFLTLLMKTYSISIFSLPTSLWVTVSFSVHSLCILNRNNCTLRHIRVYLIGSFWFFLCNLLYLLLSPPRSRRLYLYGHSHRHSFFLTPPRSPLSLTGIPSRRTTRAGEPPITSRQQRDAVERQTAVTARLKRGELPLLTFVLQCWMAANWRQRKPAGTRRQTNVWLMVGHRLQRWPNI